MRAGKWFKLNKLVKNADLFGSEVASGGINWTPMSTLKSLNPIPMGFPLEVAKIEWPCILIVLILSLFGDVQILNFIPWPVLTFQTSAPKRSALWEKPIISHAKLKLKLKVLAVVDRVTLGLRPKTGEQRVRVTFKTNFNQKAICNWSQTSRSGRWTIYLSCRSSRSSATWTWRIA